MLQERPEFISGLRQAASLAAAGTGSAQPLSTLDSPLASSQLSLRSAAVKITFRTCAEWDSNMQETTDAEAQMQKMSSKKTPLKRLE